MGNLALTTSLQDVSSYGPKRRFTLIGSSDCVVILQTGRLIGSTSYGTIADPSDPTGTKPLVLKGPNAVSPEIEEPSSFIKYTVMSGTVTSCYMEAGGQAVNVALTASTASVLGAVQLSQAPVSAATPIAVGDNDARVNTKTVPISLSGSDGSLAETIVWTAPYNCTITGAYINSSVAMAANNTDYDTFTFANRAIALPGTPVTLKATTTKAADLNALVAFTEKSLGSLSNTSLLQGDNLTFKSVASGAGKASGPALLRFTYTVP